MKLLLLDNYDSFTYNLAHLVEKVSGIVPQVVLNDQLSASDADSYDAIILSPGPGLPSEAGVMPALIQRQYKTKPILGVCLGMQALAEALGGALHNLGTVYHGIATPLRVLQQEPLFRGCPPEFLVGRYHSWVVDPQRPGDGMVITAVDLEGNIMALKHKTWNLCGLQFHPESILSEHGETILKNWLHTL